MNLATSPSTVLPAPARTPRRALRSTPDAARRRRAAVSTDAIVSAYVNEIARPRRRAAAPVTSRPGLAGVPQAFDEPAEPAEAGAMSGEEAPAAWSWMPYHQRRAACAC